MKETTTTVETKAKKKLTVKSVKHVPVKAGVRAGTTQDFTSSKNSNNGEGKI